MMIPEPVFSMTIVLVEDNQDDAELTLEGLKEFRLRTPVVHLSDGQAAIDYLFGLGAYASRTVRRPDLILLDLKLPRIDGLEVLRRLKGHPQLRRIPVVVLTSSQEESDVVMGYNLGANSYIVKPVDFEQLVATVRAIGNYWLTVNQHAPNG